MLAVYVRRLLAAALATAFIAASALPVSAAVCTGTICTVTTEAEFDTALATASSDPGNSYLITVGAGFNLSSLTTVTVAANPLTINLNGFTIGGANTFEKAGSGTLIIGGGGFDSATPVAVTGGTLEASSANITASNGSLAVASGATFALAGFNQQILGLTGSGAIDLGTATFAVGGSASTFAGSISGPGGLTKAAGSVGDLTLGGSTTYGGATTINIGDLKDGVANAYSPNSAFTVNLGGNLVVNNNETIGSLAGNGSVQLFNGSLTVGGNNTSTTFSGSTSGFSLGGLTKTGTGTFTLAQAAGFSGATVIAGGTLQAGVTNVLGTSSGLTVDAGATFALSSFNQQMFAINGTGTVDLGTATLTLANGSAPLDATLTGSGNLIKDGTDTLQLFSAGNNYTGTTTVAGGTLEGDAAGAFSQASAFTIDAGATLRLNFSDQTIGSLAGTGTLALSGGTLTTGADNTSTTFSGVSSGIGGLTKVGTGTFTLGQAAGYSGATEIAAGTLQAGATNVIGLSSGLTVDSGATFAISSFDQTLDKIGGSGTVNLGSATLTLGSAANTTFDGTLTGGGNFTKSATGTLTLNGSANNYTGATTVGAGTLQAGVAGAFSQASAFAVASGATLDLAGTNETIGSLAGAGAVTLGSGTLTTGGNNTSTAFSGATSGSGGLTKVGTGTFTLGQAAGYTGTTEIAAGTLQAGATNVLGSSSGLTVDAGATFGLASFDQTLATIQGTGTVDLGSATLTLGSTANAAFAGTLTGGGAFAKAGSGTLTLDTANNYTGATTVGAGTLQAGVAGAFAQTSAFTVANGATLDLNGIDQQIGSLAGAGTVALGSAGLTAGDGASTTFSGAIGGAGGHLMKSGSGTLTLSGSGTYTGLTDIAAGTLQAGATNAFAQASQFQVDAAGTMDLNGFDQTVGSLTGSGSVLLGSATLTAGSDNASTVFSGAMSGTGGLTKAGSGTLQLSGTSAYSGATTIAAGTLLAGAANTLASQSAFAVNTGATLDLNGGNQSIGSLAGAGNVALGAGTLIAGGNGASTTFSGIMNGAGGFTKSGTGTLTLGTAAGYTGATDVAGGTLQAGAANVIGTSSGLTVDAGATFGLASFDQTLAAIGGTGTVDLGSATLTLGSAANSSFAGTLTGGGALTKAGTGTLTLNAPSTYTGASTVAAGSLLAGTANALSADSAFTLSSGATLDLGGFAQSIGSLAGGGNVALGAGTLVAGGNGASTTFSGIMNGTGGFTKSGTGTLTLANAAAYSGATEIAGGALQAGATNVIGTSSGLTVDSGATFALASFDQTLASIGGAGTIDLGSATLTVANAANASFGGLLTGAGAFVKAGAGTLTLDTSSAYTGATTVAVGSLRAGAANAFASNSAFTLASGTTLDLNGFDQTIGSLAGGGNVALGAGTLIAGGTGASTTFSGFMSGTGGFMKSGTGTLTLSGVNNYTGATEIAGGILQAGATNAIGASAGLTVDAGAMFSLATFDQTLAALGGAGTVDLGSATLTLGSAANSTFDGTLTGAGALTKAGSGTVTLDTPNAYTGATTVTAGSLRAGAANAFASSSAFTLASGATLDLNGFDQTIGSLAGGGNVALGAGTLVAGGTGASTTFSGVMSGTGGFTKSGTGTLMLSGVNDYTGATEIAAGTLQAGVTNAIGMSSGLKVDAGALFSLASFDQTLGSIGGAGTIDLGSATLTVANAANASFDGLLTGAGALTKTGAGTLTLDTPSAYTGATTVAAGSLRAGVANAFASSSAFTLGGGAMFDLNGFNQEIGSLAGAGTVALGTAVLTTGGNGTSTTFNGTIDGSGGVTKTGGGTLTLGGASAYTGATALAAGTLRAGAANAFAAASDFTLANGATLDLAGFDQQIGSLAGTGTVALGSAMLTTGGNGTSTTFSGAINGSGGLAKIGGGTLTLGAASAYTGTTYVLGGELQAGAAHVLTSSSYGIDAPATLALAGHDQTIGSLFGSGTVALGSALLTVGADGTGTTFSGTISGNGGLTKAGAGTFVFDGNGMYTGTTTVQGGTLVLGDAATGGARLAGGVNVGANATLRGHGTIAGALLNTGGIVMPGGSIGMLAVGSYTQGAGGTFATEIANGGADELVSPGAVSLDGTLAVQIDPGTKLNGGFMLIDAGSLAGTFATVNVSGLSQLVNDRLIYTPNSVVLQFTPTLGNLLALTRTPNQVAVANAIISAQSSANDDFQTGLSALELLPNDAAIAGTLDTLSGVVHADTPLAALDGATAYARMLQTHAHTATRGIWFQYDGANETVTGDANAPSFAGSSSGATAGFDVAGGKWRGGVAVSSGRTDVAVSNAMASHGTIDRDAVGLDIDYAAGNGFSIGAETGFGALHFAAADPIRFGTISRIAASAVDGSEFTAGLDMRYDAHIGRDVSLAPHAGVAYADVTRNGFTETGAGALGLAVAASDLSVAQAIAGLGLELGGSGVHGALRADWHHDFTPLAPAFAAQFAGVGPTSAMTIAGIVPARDAAIVSGSLAVPVGKAEFFADADAALSTNQTHAAYDAGLRVRF